MQRMRQNSSGAAQTPRTPEEMDRRRLGLSELGLSELLPAARSSPPGSIFDFGRGDFRQVNALPFNASSTRSARSFSRAARIGSSSRAGPVQRNANAVPSEIANAAANANAASSAGISEEIDFFHDCMAIDESGFESPTFWNLFDDLALEGTEVGRERDEDDPQADGSSRPNRSGPIYDPVASTGGSSRGFSCKRKSCNMPSSATSSEGLNISEGFSGHQGGGVGNGGDFPQRASLMLPPPTFGASSSRSAALMEGPRPQKTRLSADALDSEAVFPSPRRADLSFGNSIISDPSQSYPRTVRRAFSSGPEAFRVRRPDSGSAHFNHLTPTPRDGNTPIEIFGGGTAPRIHGGGASALGGGHGLSRRIGRISSSRSLSANPSMLRDHQTESRTRSIRMACLENGAFSAATNHGGASSIRRDVASYLGARYPSLADSRQGFNTAAGRSALLNCHPSHTMAPPQNPTSLMDEAEMRPPNVVFDGSQTSRAPPALAVGRRDLSSLTEDFIAVSSFGFEWEHRLMGIAQILQALERVERDEDLTREQLLMLEASTSWLNGVSLRDDHSDWRLDIDNMTYEELLALGDRIGTVSTGVTEDVIIQKLKRGTYSSALIRGKEDSDLKCCICQEEFEEDVELGTIECGHNYHRGCIRQWLLRKNSCPICKATGLSSSSESRSPSSNA